MAISRQPRIILSFAALGAVIALAICIAGQFLPFHPYWVSNVVVVACPPSLMLMATEGCAGILSWCSMQIILLVILSNAIFYATLGVIFASLVSLASRLRRGAA